MPAHCNLYILLCIQTTDHPVLLTGKGSKWKVFTEPQDSNSEEVKNIPPPPPPFPLPLCATHSILLYLHMWSGLTYKHIQEEEGGTNGIFKAPYTTDRAEFDMARRKKRRELKRHYYTQSQCYMYYCIMHIDAKAIHKLISMYYCVMYIHVHWCKGHT